MAGLFSALLIVAVAISTSRADSNHQEQDFGDCGHRLTKAECDAYAAANGGAGSTSTQVDGTDKPRGCYKIPADGAASTPVPLSFVFNGNAASTVKCSTTNPCICDKLVGGFDTSAVLCNSQGYEPTFTYNPGTQTQDVVVDIKLGTGTTSGASLDAQGQDQRCFSSKTGTSDATTVTTKTDFDGSAWSDQVGFGTVAAPVCGGALTHETIGGVEKIQFQIAAEATVTRNFRTKTVQRKRKYTFKIKCLMTRAVTASSTIGFTVAAALIEANEEEEVSKDFSFSASIKFYNEGYAAAQSSTLTPNNNEKVYAAVEKGDNQALFVYSIEKCYATIGNDANVATAGHKDTFFDAQCPLDETMDFEKQADGDFRFEIQAFSFATGNAASDEIYLHCDLKVCLADGSTLEGDCPQKTSSQCTTPIANNRRRRDISYKSLATGSRIETVTSTQAILLEGSQFHAPRCGNGFVYDRVSQECSRSNLMEVKGIRLSRDHFDVDYFNTSSKAFKDMAQEKEFLLWVLIRTSGQSETIRGVQVIKASPGSVILDVVVKHSHHVTPDQAFAIFKEEVIGASSRVTRVQNVLLITEKNNIQYIPMVSSETKPDSEKLILIVVIAVLFVVVFVASVTLFKVKQTRRQASNPQPTAGFENKGIDA